MSETEEDRRYLAVLDGNPGAQQIYQGWRGLGYDPARAWSEMRRSGAWTDPHAHHRFLQRPPAFWQTRLGNRGPALDGFRGQLAMGGRLLADWQLLNQSELDWLQAIAKGRTVDLKLTPDEAKEILRVHDESGKDLARWIKLSGEKVGRGGLSDDQKAIGKFWWRATPPSYQMGGGTAANGSGWPTGRQ